MMKWQLLILTVLFSNHSWASVRTYMNHNPASSYTDPYRQISRPGDNLEKVIVDTIRAAKKSVYVAVQELRLPLIAQALIEKMNEGVDVRVILEHDYNKTVLNQRDPSDSSEYEASKLSELFAFVDLNKNGRLEKEELETRDAIYMLRQAKVPLIDDTSDNSKGSGLMHHKFVVVDEKTTIVSTANFTMSCIHGDVLVHGSRGNANSMIQVGSIAFAKLFVEEFQQLWGTGRRGNFGQNKTYRGPQTVIVRGTKLTVQFSPTSRRYMWEETVNGLIASQLSKAQHTVKAALFVFSDQRLSNVLQNASNRGAKMGFLIEPKFAYREYSELLDMLGIAMLSHKCTYEPDNNPWAQPAREVGMAVLPRGDVLHHKFAVVDGKTVIVGSQNWSDAANHNNDETLVVIQDSGVSDSYTQEYNRLVKSSVLGISKRVQTEIQNREAACAGLGF
jgi:phosphatidylserine/phosphatidylglycerophosphate/cardiolipin synthase-like enzyme